MWCTNLYENDNCPKDLLCRDLSNFPVRPSSVLSVCPPQRWTAFLQNLLIRIQELNPSSKPGPFGTMSFCTSKPVGSQSECSTYPFPSRRRQLRHVGIIKRSHVLWRRLGKFGDSCTIWRATQKKVSLTRKSRFDLHKLCESSLNL